MMKNLFTKVCSLLIVLIVSSCGDDGPDTLPVGETLEGSWIMTEYGYSPGSGYVTKGVSTDPARTITFKTDGTLQSNVDGFSAYQYYQVLEIPQAPENKIVALFTTKPQGPHDVNTVSPAYHITFTEDLLKLSMRGCIEGCHIGLKRTADPEPGSNE